jgi:uncharacterized protein YpmB
MRIFGVIFILVVLAALVYVTEDSSPQSNSSIEAVKPSANDSSFKDLKIN